mmetsp:Transcript_60640/g.162701  ORF Transcript_60640/g.162701 Transcript_60640/m.162701 type:complete len:126 (-) Transcript_60640:176-553(-)
MDTSCIQNGEDFRYLVRQTRRRLAEADGNLDALFQVARNFDYGRDGSVEFCIAEDEVWENECIEAQVTQCEDLRTTLKEIGRPEYDLALASFSDTTSLGFSPAGVPVLSLRRQVNVLGDWSRPQE